MRVRRLAIKNFRSIRNEVIHIGSQTALLGPNGAGKSTILRALDRFYGSSTQMDPDDFFGRNYGEPIEIALTFDTFSELEREQFASRIQGEEMTVVRIFEAGARNTGRYHGMSSQHPPFAAIRGMDGTATQKRQAYMALRAEGGIYADADAATNAEQLSDGMAKWETDHPEHCEPTLDDGQFFGFSNVAKGLLSKASTLVFIPAIRDAALDAADAKGAVIAQLMELLVRSAVQRREDVRQWQSDAAQKYKELVAPENLTELRDLSGKLSETLQVFYRDAAVELQWKPADDFSVPLPTADVLLNDDGFEGPVDRKGHGLQRALILTLLQHLAVAVATKSGEEAEGEAAGSPDEEVAVGEAAAAAEPEVQMPGLVLAIEEPEVYQHPTKQRHFAAVLSNLSSGALPGVATDMQVVFASHSPLFVSTDRFDEIRLARRALTEGQEFKECRCVTATLEAVAQRLERIWAKAAGAYNAEGVRARLHIINPEVAEGFFATLAVLVEGPGDKAAIMAAADLAGVDLAGRGIAVLPTNGKNNIDRPAVIFEALGIPTYVVWDCDNGTEGVETNRALCRFGGLAEPDLFDAQTRVEPSFTCFENKLESILEAELPSLQDCIDEVREGFGIAKKDEVLKSAFAMREVLSRAGAKGHQSGTLGALVNAIAIRAAGN